MCSLMMVLLSSIEAASNTADIRTDNDDERMTSVCHVNMCENFDNQFLDNTALLYINMQGQYLLPASTFKW